MSKYSLPFIASTNEKVSCQKFIEVINQPSIACNYEEINLKNSGQNISFNPLSLLKIMLKKIMGKITLHAQNKFNIFVTAAAEKKLSLKEYWINIRKINFAQSLDIEAFKETYKNQVEQLKRTKKGLKKNIVLYGVSRGAATIFNFVSIYKPKEVKAVICEGMFDSIPQLLQRLCPLTYPFVLNTLEMFTQFRRHLISPIDNACKIPHEVPILLIGSLNDEIVPVSCALNVYRKLRSIGHNKVHLLILNHSKHNWYTNEEQDKELYEQIVHAFYKHYKLPFIFELAIKGEKYFFERTQPNF